MNEEIISKAKEKICRDCKDKDRCSKKPHKLQKCGVMYLVSKN